MSDVGQHFARRCHFTTRPKVNIANIFEKSVGLHEWAKVFRGNNWVWGAQNISWRNYFQLFDKGTTAIRLRMLQPDSYRIYIEYRLFSVSSQLLNTTPYSPRVPVSFDNFQQNYIMEGKERGSLHCLVDEMDGLGHSIVLIRDAFKNYLADFFPLRGYPPPPLPP